MRSPRLRRTVYRRTVTEGGDSFDLVVTRERNGNAVFRTGANEAPVMIAWLFDQTEAVDHVLGHLYSSHPPERQNLFPKGSISQPEEELERIVYKRELIDGHLLVITREMNGCLLLAFGKDSDHLWVYGMYPDSTTAIDELDRRTRNRF